MLQLGDLTSEDSSACREFEASTVCSFDGNKPCNPSMNALMSHKIACLIKRNFGLLAITLVRVSFLLTWKSSSFLRR